MGIAYAAYFKADMDNVKKTVGQYEALPERLGRLEQKTDDIKESVHRIEGYIRK